MRRRHWIVAIVIVGALAAASPALGDTFTVTRFGDPAPDGCGAGDCSLREAIIAANANTGSDRIPLRAGTYQLSILGTAEDAAANGDLDVTGSLRITGAGLGATAIDGGGDVTGERVLHLDPTPGGFTVAVRLSRLTVTGGGNATSSFGGGIRADNESRPLADAGRGLRQHRLKLWRGVVHRRRDGDFLPQRAQPQHADERVRRSDL